MRDKEPRAVLSSIYFLLKVVDWDNDQTNPILQTEMNLNIKKTPQLLHN